MKSIDSEPSDPNKALSSNTSNVKRPFDSITRRLDINELKQSGTQKLILAENDRLEVENFKLKEFEDKFHDKDKECEMSLP
jgi:hypothetical protein